MRSALPTAFFGLILVQAYAQPIDWGYYHKTDEIFDFLKEAARKVPGKLRYEDIQDPDSQFRLPLVTITDFASGVAGKEVLLLVAGEHARELITAEIVYWVGSLLTGERTEEFLEWAATQPIQATAWKSGWTKGTLSEWAQQLLTKVVFKIFPIQNIAGRKSVESGTVCLRKTISGVDLNRNWPFAWQKTGEGTVEFGGSKPFSEPESRIVRLVAENTQPQAYVNLHSGEWAMYVPWDSQKETAPGLPADAGELLEKMNAFCACMKGAAGEVAGYLAHGTSMDWMYAEQHVPYPITFEVFGPKGLGKIAHGGHPRRQLREDNGQAAETQCFEAFNPTTQEDYESTVAGWVGTLLVLADHLAVHPHATAASLTAQQHQLPEPEPPPSKQELSRHGFEIMRMAQDGATRTGPLVKKGLGRKAGDASSVMLKQLQGSRQAGRHWLTRLAYAVLLVSLGGLLMVLWMRLRPSAKRQSGFGKHHRVQQKDLL